MRRATPVILAVLLGALATAIGMGVFLKLANDDRIRLADEAAQAKIAIKRAEEEKATIANDANRKVAAANQEVTKAQLVLKDLQEERALLATAKQLAKPSTRDLRGWQPVISLGQGLGLSLPPKTSVESNDAAALTAVKTTTTSAWTDARWLSVGAYDYGRERELTSALATTTPLAYLVEGRLLLGVQGSLGNGDRMAVLRIREAASSTHLLWIKDPGTLGYGNGIERFLATLDFRD
ncbi:hypothetical protein A3E39_04135 [Candidatus Uhrbacteria bacterium RIFCSPHIGHO2_12_FULL_60_25]|uniref:Uncharacterized protein n=1 Tax=Candidatus Uhrbacteria bacterium RIFCSPHIGHO2_12_FULL_60_25 TaxID=1802399 RepID=A0A1F7UMZ1_9BACT|nr:MAG: hypothetical protein A3D73_02485 [Candidatus Uhrbacteria bacterium RIFCSPHIGHO2_02_FULL_60_44]OGL79124.1 MAG: hypothetical protein A3E39_04135 [Candidatus Uhrbacteria bacterium RIFCSPHIGHO2_12_FULL_60_25]